MKKVAIIGAGISGLGTARLLLEKGYQVKVFEKEDAPGGLIRCKRVEGSLFHLCGGHVFNSRRQDVLDRFWRFFPQADFEQRERNSVVVFDDGRLVPYPVEDHVYCFDETVQRAVIADFLQMASDAAPAPDNFADFLRRRFGQTLYDLYFGPYNEKIWMQDLKEIPLSWLEGKLPMPTVAEMIYNNVNRVAEKKFVHSSFWYERRGGSQYLADRLADGLDIVYGASVGSLARQADGWLVQDERFDGVVFCGDIRDLVRMVRGVGLEAFRPKVEALACHGTTAVFCEIEANPYTWIYQPSRSHRSHRIICTGNFAESNNAPGKLTATVEFTGPVPESEIRAQLARMPFSPKYITHHYTPCSYPVQDASTRSLIRSLKDTLRPHGLYFTGRFADWEYYNMDVALGAALDTVSGFSL